MTDAPTGRSLLPWAGIHHIALVTPDLDVTRAFYGDVLGMHIGEVRVGGGVLPARHCFVRPGADATTWGVHFFEQPGVVLPQYPDGLAGLREAGYLPGAFQHLAFALPDAASAQALCERLAARGFATTPPSTIGSIQNVLFFDPHGVLLEATWPAPWVPANEALKRTKRPTAPRSFRRGVDRFAA